MATESQRTRFWADTGSTSAVFDASEVDDIFEEAGETYSTTAAIKAATRVIAIRRLLASSAKLTNYRQNQSSESLSDVFKHLNQLLDLWEGELATAAASGRSVAKFGRPRRIPRQIVEYPDE